MNSRADQFPNGFTLLEMIVVLVILGLMAAMVVPRLATRGTPLESRLTLNELAQTLRLARGQAIAGNRPVAVLIDVAQPAVQIAGGTWQRLPPSLRVSVTAAPGDISGNRLAGIIFHPDGSSSGGTISLSDGRQRMQISVDWLTGRVSTTDAQ